jgi:tetratricopeptide (TPR) repeat protein
VGDTSGAIENYAKAIAILEILSDSPDINIKTQAGSDLIVAYQTLGMMQTRVFAHTDSIATQRKALALVEAKSASAPEDNDVQYQLVRARGRLADSMREGGQFDEAIKIYRSALALDEEIFRRAPENENAEVAVAVLNDRIGRNLALRAIDLKRTEAPPDTYQPLFAEAEERINRMFFGFERLVAAHPEKKKYRRDLSTAYGTLGMIYRETGRLEESSRLLREDLQKRQTVAALDGFDRESQADLSEALTELAQTETAQKKFSDAFAHFAQATAIYDRLIDADQANVEFRRLRFETENYFTDALRQSGDIAKALELYRTAFEKLKTNAPAENPYFKFAEGLMQEKIGDVYMRQNKFIEAAEAYRKALELWSGEEQAKINELGRSPERIDWIRKKTNICESRVEKSRQTRECCRR